MIAGKTPLVGISFGNPYLLQNFPELRTYLVAYGDMPSLQEATARALLGQIDVVGKSANFFAKHVSKGVRDSA